MQCDHNGGIAVGEVDPGGFLRIRKLTSTGVNDASFGTDGRVKFARTSYAESAIASADGGLLFAGPRRLSDWTPRVLKLTPSGARDESFGHNGVATSRSDLFADGAQGARIAERPDGSVAVAGVYYDFSGVRQSADGQSDFTEPPYASLITPDGRVDTSFGDDDFVTGFGDMPPYDVLFDTRDRVVCTVGNFTIVRFQK